MLWYAFNSYICEVCISSFENSLVNNDAKNENDELKKKKQPEIRKNLVNYFLN